MTIKNFVIFTVLDAILLHLDLKKYCEKSQLNQNFQNNDRRCFELEDGAYVQSLKKMD